MNSSGASNHVLRRTSAAVQTPDSHIRFVRMKLRGAPAFACGISTATEPAENGVFQGWCVQGQRPVPYQPGATPPGGNKGQASNLDYF